jgi:hypothetical protein
MTVLEEYDRGLQEEVLEAIRVVNLFYESRGGSSEIVTKIVDIERNLESVYWASNRKQITVLVSR